MAGLSQLVRRLAVAAMTGLALLGLVVGVTLAAPGDGRTPDNATPLVVSTAGQPAVGELAGSSGGGFLYYSFDYSVENAPITLTLTISSPDPDVDNAVGVVLWMEGEQLATMTATGYTPGINSMTFSAPSTGPILLQLYSYTDTPVTFAIELAPAAQ